MAEKQTIYLKNKDLLEEVIKCKKKGQMSNELAKMLQLLCARYARKGNFVNYTYNEDMQSYAIMGLVKTWDRFDPEVSTNAFAWYTQCIKNSFIQYLNYEKKNRNARDLLLIDAGLAPSYGYTEEGSDMHIVEDEQDYYEIKHNATLIKKQSKEDVEIIVVDAVEEPVAVVVEIPVENSNETVENDELEY